jgi:molybdopterin-guanine dinucleotide biosynthesis protein A
LKHLTSSRPDGACIEAAILAGGSARRFEGRSKGALLVAGQTVLDRQIAAMRGVADRIMIVGGASGGVPPGVDTIPDEQGGLGPLGGISTALAHATTDRLLIVACDMPFLTPAFLAFLAGAGRDCDATVPRDARGPHPLCASWAVAAGPVIRDLLGRGVRKVGTALEALRVHFVEGGTLAAFDPDGWLLHNINTPEDYRRACARRR